jgi:hypothetical protein
MYLRYCGVCHGLASEGEDPANVWPFVGAICRFLLRWLPKLALRRARARAELRRLEQQLAEPPGTCRIQAWSDARQRSEPAGSLLPSPWLGCRQRR